MEDLSEGPTHAGVTIHEGTVQDGIGAEQLIAYIEDDASRPNWPLSHPDYLNGYVERFGKNPPQVIAAEGTSKEQFSDLVRAVQLINTWLPPDWQMTMGELSESEVPLEQDGKITVHFLPWEEFAPYPVAGRYGSSGLGVTGYDDPRFPFGHSYQVVSGVIWISSEAYDNTGNNEKARLGTLAHEIIHTLGRTHVDGEEFGETIMAVPRSAEWKRPDDILGKLDEESLQAIYGVLAPGLIHKYIAEDLGDWEDESRHLVGSIDTEIGAVTFGVAERNGFVQAWANGPTPWSNLSDNPSLTGSATWDGRLIGLTPQSEAVVGEASITVTAIFCFADLVRVVGRRSDGVERKARVGEAGSVASGVGERSGTGFGLKRDAEVAVRTPRSHRGYRRAKTRGGNQGVAGSRRWRTACSGHRA